MINAKWTPRRPDYAGASRDFLQHILTFAARIFICARNRPLAPMGKLHTTAKRVVVCGCAVAGVFLMGLAAAQDYPTKAVRVVVAMPAGGGGDLNARRLADRLSKIWKLPVLVENVAGAAGNAAAVKVAMAPADGHTLFFASHPILAINPFLYDRLPFDAERDFVPVVLVSEAPHVLLANKSLPVPKLKDLIALAKARPGSLNFGSGGTGTSIHLAGELLKSYASTDLTHIPYKGAAPAFTALIADEIQMLFDSSMTAIGHIKGGRVRGLAITSLTRSEALPEVPTFDESGLPGFEAGVAHGILVRTSTPANVVAALNKAVNAAMSEPEYRRQMGDLGVNLIGGPAENFRAYLAGEKKKWGLLIQKLGIKVN